MFYTIMPLEAVLAGYEEHRPRYTEMPYKSAVLVVEPLTVNSARVVRLISSDPTDYLDPAVQPGSIIEYKAQSQAGFYK